MQVLVYLSVYQDSISDPYFEPHSEGLLLTFTPLLFSALCFLEKNKPFHTQPHHIPSHQSPPHPTLSGHAIMLR